jgi:hypothetical protein
LQKPLKITEEQKVLDLREEVIRDIDYNTTPGVGGSKCSFKLEAIEKLSRQSFDNEIKEVAQEIVVAGKLCNAYGGVRHLEKTPGAVKALNKKLKELLK